MDTEASEIGTEIRRLRTWRGMSLEVLAGQAGLSKGYLSKIENGHVALDRRSTLLKIARALRVSLADLTSDHYLSDRSDSDAHAAIPDIRMSLLSTTLDQAPRASAPARSVGELAAQAQQLAEWRANCREADVGRAMPALLTDLHTAAAIDSNDRRPALQSLVQATNSTAHLLKTLGAVDLAWVAAERGHHAAQLLEDPLYIAAADYARAQALIGLGAYERAEAIAQSAVGLLTPETSAATEVYGMNVLITAFCAEMAGSDSAAELQEAEEAASRVEPVNAFWFNFSRTNVNQWRLSLALEAGDHVKAAEIAAQIRPEDIPTKGRRLGFYVDHARALHGLRRRDSEVVQLLQQAEKLGAVRARHSIWAREIVSEMLLRSRRDAGGRELRGLADRMGLLHAV